MLVQQAIADAYGLGFEFKPKETFAQNDLSQFHRHGYYYEIAPGCYSDDTQRAIANIETVLEHGPRATAEQYADMYVSCFRRDPRLGYSKGYFMLLKSSYNGTDLMQKINPTSDRGGAVMGVTPLGRLPNISDVIFAATTQASVTHNTEIGLLAAKCGALCAHFSFRNVEPSKLRQHLYEHLTEAEKTLLSLHKHTDAPVSENACEIFNAALDAIEAGTVSPM
jgi:ADP-ribosyl-[dinitrogen reductase] hydrolase